MCGGDTLVRAVTHVQLLFMVFNLQWSIYMWCRHSCVAVTHIQFAVHSNEHAGVYLHVAVTHMWKGNLRVVGTHM